MRGIDLGSAELATVLRILAEHVPGAKVWAFGSRAMGTARRFSDLDLALEGGVSLTPEALGRLREALSLSDLPISVDIVDLSRAPPRFREAVMRLAMPLC